MNEITDSEWAHLCRLMNGYILSQTLSTACDLGIIDYLARCPGSTAPEISAGIKLSDYSTRVLLLSCSAIGIIVRDCSGLYFNSSLSDKVLRTDTSTSMVPFIKFNRGVQQPCSAFLTRSLQESRNAGLDSIPGEGATLYERIAHHPHLESLFQDGMAAYTRLSPKIEFLEEFDGVRRLLDVGGGDATTAIRMCDRYPRLEVIVLETPSVCAIGRRNVVERGLTDRISFIEADMFGDEWPSGMDGVLFSHVVEIFCPERVHVLYRKAQSSLSSGGVLFVWTIMANDDETAGLQAAKSSTYFLSTASGEGMAYPAREHVEWLAALGYRDIKRYDHPSIEHGAIVAHFG